MAYYLLTLFLKKSILKSDRKNMSKHKKLTTKDLILYILQKVEPERSDKIRLNKIAFFTEFGYFHKKQAELSETKFAGINFGPVINQYAKILRTMESDGLIKIDGNLIRPLSSPVAEIPEEVKLVIDPLIEKYSGLSNVELITLSHATDSYKITTDNEKKMGNIIDKELAALETFFEEVPFLVNENEFLPKIDPKKLVKYVP